MFRYLKTISSISTYYFNEEKGVSNKIFKYMPYSTGQIHIKI